MYRFTGPNGFIMKQLFDSLLGAESVAAQPDQAETIMASFRDADRKGMLHAMRSMMLKRSRHRGSAAEHQGSDAGDARARRRHGLAAR